MRRLTNAITGWLQVVTHRGTARLRCKVLCLIFLHSIALSGQAVEAVRPDDDDALYREALDDMNDGRPQLAISKLNALIARTPSHAGALLDLAIAYCQSETPSEAEPLFIRLAQLPDLPPAIDELIIYYRTNCRPLAPHWRAYAALGFGRADNLNQSPGTDFFYLGSLGLALQLAESAWPRNDNSRLLEAAIYRQAPDTGWGGALFFQGSDYSHSNDYDTSLGQASVSYRHKTEDAVQLEAQGSAGTFVLGGETYLTSLSGNLSVMRPLSVQGQWQIGAIGSVTNLDYLTLPEYRARVYEGRARLKWQPNMPMNLVGELGWSRDDALANRPGGNKTGPVTQLIAQWAPRPRQIIELINRQAWFSDETPYSPILFGEQRRHSHLSSWNIAWRYQLPGNLTLRLEARRAANNDSIPLFSYRSSSYGVLLEWWQK